MYEYAIVSLPPTSEFNPEKAADQITKMVNRLAVTGFRLVKLHFEGSYPWVVMEKEDKE